MARAMPVISISAPRKMNNGTASRMRWDMPSSRRPTITISGLQLANLLGGTVVLESIFAWPGIGRAIFEAILQRDYPLVQAGVLVLGCIVVVMNLLVDLTYRLLNPRVKLG